MSVILRTPYQEFADFVTSSPSLKQISEYRLSDDSEARIIYLLEANRNGTLTSQETDELDDYTHLEHLMRIIKIRTIAKIGHE